ncbi:beta-ketoacyl-ACP synthase III [Clostridium thermarum]|uniref:beta-ketoacyl-ACP synthase III n=1 Tax=Clostridium thermarum TaxID=1716543 RepID=UPI0013D62431|nr:beta-ketoacyl-ACP synthase III [Clostridium thermarum]
MGEVYISGTGRYVPENIITNDDLAKIVDTSDEWISSRSGIKERRITSGENTSDLAVKAAKNALENAGVSAENVDLIIVATVTPDMFTPATACLVQSKLGAKKAAAFDINAACTGFIYGISVGTQFIKTGVYNHVLVIGAETLSKIVNWQDRSTCVLFGDGAGAVLLSSSKVRGVGSILIAADGEKGEVLQSHALPINNPYAPDNIEHAGHNHIVMDGREVFKFATSVMAESVEEILKRENLTMDDIQYVIPHQANVRIIDYATRKLSADPSKFYVNLDKYGNTSSASIPIALDEINRNGLLSNGDKLIIVGFGGGLTNGAAFLQWQK